MLLNRSWLAAIALLAAAGCDSFDASAPGSPPSAAPVAASSKAAAVEAPELERLGAAAVRAILAYAERCEIDTCANFGEALQYSTDACPHGAADLKPVSDAIAPFLAYADAHPVLFRKTRTFATHVRLFDEWLPQGGGNGVLAKYEQLAEAYDAWRPEDRVTPRPESRGKCFAGGGKSHPVSVGTWKLCDGVPCF